MEDLTKDTGDIGKRLASAMDEICELEQKLSDANDYISFLILQNTLGNRLY